MSETEEQFYKTFGIEPINKCFNGDCIVKEEIGYDSNICDDKCVYIDRQYPQITDRILLELICTLNKSRLVPAVNLSDFNYEDLKNTVLRKNITILKNEFLNNEIRNDFKHQVQALFKENN